MEQRMCPVDVIFWSSTDGKLLPLRIRAQEGLGEAIVGNVSEILSTRENNRIGAEYHAFLCRVRTEETTKVMELKYFIRSHSWYMSLTGV